MSPTNALVPTLAETSEHSYFHRVLQEGFQSGRITPTFLSKIDRQVSALAERLVLRRTKKLTPTHEELEGAHLMVRSWINSSLEQSSGGNLNRALDELLKTPLTEFYRRGQAERQQLMDFVQETMNQWDKYRLRFNPDEEANLSIAIILLETNLEFIYQAHRNPKGPAGLMMSSGLQSVFDIRAWVIIGDRLEAKYSSFCRQHRRCQYREMIGNIVVSLSQNEPVAVPQNWSSIHHFLIQTRSSEEWDRIGNLVLRHLDSLEVPMNIINWFSRKIWPDLVRLYQTVPRRSVACRDHAAFFPAELSDRMIGVGSVLPTPEEFRLLLSEFKQAGSSGKVELLRDYHPNLSAMMLDDLSSRTSALTAVRLFNRLSPKAQARVLWGAGLNDHEGGLECAETRSEWARLALDKVKLNKRRCARLTKLVRTFEATLQNSPGHL